MTMHSMPMDGMTMGEMAMDNMATNDIEMDGMVMGDTVREGAPMDNRMAHQDGMQTQDMATTSSSPGAEDDSLTGKIEQPLETCTHCLSHSGFLNAPLSSVSVPDQSNRYLGSVPLAVSRFLVRSAMAITQNGIPKQHAPPGRSTPRYVLIGAFLI